MYIKYELLGMKNNLLSERLLQHLSSERNGSKLTMLPTQPQRLAEVILQYYFLKSLVSSSDDEPDVKPLFDLNNYNIQSIVFIDETERRFHDIWGQSGEGFPMATVVNGDTTLQRNMFLRQYIVAPFSEYSILQYPRFI